MKTIKIHGKEYPVCGGKLKMSGNHTTVLMGKMFEMECTVCGYKFSTNHPSGRFCENIIKQS